MLITGGLLMNTRRPGSWDSLRVRERATSSALIVRSSRGLRWMKSRPWFTVEARPPAPTADMNRSTLGSACTTAAAACWCSTMAS